MAWFHDEHGYPTDWRSGKFDPTHLYPLLVVLVPVVYILLRGR